MRLLLLSAAVLGAACTGERSADGEPDADRGAVASISGVPVAPDEVDRRYEALRRDGTLKAPLDPAPIKADLADDLIDELVLEQEARRRGIPGCEGQPDDRRGVCIRSLALVLADAESIEVTRAEIDAYYASHLWQLSDGVCTSGVEGPAGAAAIGGRSGTASPGPQGAIGATSRERLSDWGDTKPLTRNAPGLAPGARVGSTTDPACRIEVFERRIEAAIRERRRTARVGSLLASLREQANATNFLMEGRGRSFQLERPQRGIHSGAFP